MPFRFDWSARTIRLTPLLLLGVVAATCLAPQGMRGAAAPEQQNGDVTLTADEPLFSVLAAINAAGYSAGLASEPPTGARTEVREWCLRRHPAVLPALAEFYRDHKLSDPAEDLGQYVSLALLLGPPPEFKFTIPYTDLPPDANGVRDIVPLLQRFYREADLQELWIRMQPRYDEVIAGLSPTVRHTLALTDGYLRFPSGAYLGRTYFIYVALLAASGAVQARIYGDNYYLMFSPPAGSTLAKIRYQYLHFLLDPLALKYATEIRLKAPLAALARPAPALGGDFKEDFSLLVTECLIRAVELRMDKPPQPEHQVAELTREGLILVPYFYSALGDYAAQASSMTVYYRQMILGISLAAERKRLADVKFASAASTPAAPGHATVPLTPQQTAVDQGDDLIFEGKYLEAKAAFESVLAADPRNEGALFGLAVVASNTRKPDTAEEYFKQTLQIARNLRILTWSHIYLGRLYDIEGRRSQALAQYRAALVTAAAYPDAERAAQDGQSAPYGSTQ